jgi:branched-chain amino acid transport system substrate-binding protein
MRKHSPLGIFIAALVITAAACQPAATPSPTATSAPPPAPEPTPTPTPSFTLKVALLLPTSGDLAQFGVPAASGADLAFEEARSAGWGIQVVRGDTQCNRRAASDLATQAIDEQGVQYIIGDLCSGSSVAISDLADAAGVLQISPSSTDPRLTTNPDGSNRPYIFRVNFFEEYQGDVSASFAFNELEARAPAVLYASDSDYSRSMAERYKLRFEELGGEVAVFEPYSVNDTDFTPLLALVESAGADVLFLPDTYNTASRIAQQARDRGLAAVLQGPDGWDSLDFDTELMDGAYFTRQFAPDDPRPVVQQFVANYKAAYNVDPVPYAALAYDAARILVKGAFQAGTVNPRTVKDKLHEVRYEGVTGVMTFDDVGNPQKVVPVYHVEAGALSFVDNFAP